MLIRLLLLAALTVVAVVPPSSAIAQEAPREKVTAARVVEAIERGRRYLLSQQDRNGRWSEWGEVEKGGVTALALLALINAGQDVKSAEVQSGLQALRRLGPPGRDSGTYAVSLATMVFAIAEPETDLLLLKRNVQWLEATQVQQDTSADPNDRANNKGGWGYGRSGRETRAADESNAQFAMLALHEAERAGVKVDPQTWRRAADYWLRKQHTGGNDLIHGGWQYPAFDNPSGSMTAAGISSLVIASGRVSADARIDEGGNVVCCGGGDDIHSRAVARGIDWLSRPGRMTVTHNPGHPQNAHFYYLYGLERVGRMTARRFVGAYDWYREGADFLVHHQNKLDGSWIGATGLGDNNKTVATSFALLFLSKGRWPVVVSRLKHGEGEEWNTHRDAVNNLVRFTEGRWKKNLTWQVIDIKPARLEDLLESPVLLISGRTGLSFNAEQKQKLRRYVDEGGFIFAENCCGGAEFDRQFQALMRELFPESPLRKLEPSHPIWYADARVDPDHLAPLWGLDACCRTSVVYSSESLSCYWELGRLGREAEYPARVQARVQAYHQIGCNVLAYATNRELKDKLDAPQIAASDPGAGPLGPGRLSIAKVSHGGGADDAPAALSMLLRVLADQRPIRTNPTRKMLALTDPAIYENPVLFMHGRRAFRLSDDERAAVKLYCERGGLLFIDSICSSESFSESVRGEMRAIFGQPLVPIAADDPLLSAEYRGFDLAKDRVTLREPATGAGEALRVNNRVIVPRLEGMRIGDRWGVILSPYDISCALENAAAGQCKSYTKADAARIGINVLLYALQE